MPSSFKLDPSVIICVMCLRSYILPNQTRVACHPPPNCHATFLSRCSREGAWTSTSEMSAQPLPLSIFLGPE